MSASWEILILWWAGLTAAWVTLPGTLELLLVTGGVLRMRDQRKSDAMAERQRISSLAVVIPAHNEATVIARCVRSLHACMRPQAAVTVVVVADNCTDDTAARAAQAGARVLIRHDSQRRGKGYALDHAFRVLIAEGHEAVLVVDADTTVAANFLLECTHAFETGAEAIQCRYKVANPDASVRTRLMRIALLAFNELRPVGRSGWGLSAGLLGNGFGLSRATLLAVPYEATSVVEDLEYHLRLVEAGCSVRFVGTTTVYGEMPAQGRGVRTQRARWEGGRFRMLRERVPGLARGWWRGERRLLEPLLDLLLLPLAYHVSLLALAALTPSWVVRGYAAFGLLLVVGHIGAALLIGGLSRKDWAALAAAPGYIAWKWLMVPTVLTAARRSTAWVRTERTRG